MPQLTVRNIEEQVVSRLHLQAAEHGVSVEEEHRRILRKALLGDTESGKTFSDHLLAIPQSTEDEPPGLFERQRDLPRELAL